MKDTLVSKKSNVLNVNSKTKTNSSDEEMEELVLRKKRLAKEKKEKDQKDKLIKIKRNNEVADLEDEFVSEEPLIKSTKNITIKSNKKSDSIKKIDNLSIKRVDDYSIKRVGSDRTNKKRSSSAEVNVSINDRNTSFHNNNNSKTKEKHNRSINAVRNMKNKVTDDVESETSKEDSTEYKGLKRGKKTLSVIVLSAKGIINFVMALAKTIALVIKNIVLVSVIVVAVVSVVVIVAVQNVTYNFISDEEEHIREIMSNITYSLSAEISEQKTANNCEIVASNGELASWKEVIALWWAIKENISDNKEWENYFDGDDSKDLEYLFYQFNNIEYKVTSSFVGSSEKPPGENPGEGEEDESEDKITVDGVGNINAKTVLNVKITNKTLDDLVLNWGLSEYQKHYLNELLADEKIWEELLGSTELSQIAYAEIGNTNEKYQTIYETPAEGSVAFVSWCLLQRGFLSDSFIPKCGDAETLMNSVGPFLKPKSHKGKEGDIIFLNENNILKAGIITKIDGDTLYVTIQNHTGTDIVTEIAISKESGLIKAYAHIDGFFVDALSGYDVVIAGAGQFLWPVGAELYRVTSCFGPRELFGSYHYGTDIACPTGTPIIAVASGTVTLARNSYTAGNYIIIDHQDGLQSVYMHNSELLVMVGQQVTAGEVIALSGNTGAYTTGPHFHIGVKLNGKDIDAAPYLGIPSNWTGDATEYVK